ncbi:energy transducer TonB [Novosphingobium sp.]|uniref:energy transducer TonB family protein n=1 Tax=Novosphingobium sp. TaxID=1874826 RepID=UPI0025D70DEA|nr:TonB family protein [Novosphingobium sp.]
MKLALTAACAASLCLSAFIPAAAFADDPIVVKSRQVTASQWKVDLSKSLSRNLDDGLRNGLARYMRGSGGIAAITFRLDEQGRADEVALARSSGDIQVDRVAKWAVRRLNAVAPYPAAANRAMQVRAYLIVAPDQDVYDRMAHTAQDIERQRQIAQGHSAGEIVLTVLPGKSA